MKRHAVACPRRARSGYLDAGRRASPADKAFGEYLSSECVTCHQLTGRYEGIPPIVGWPEASFIAIMKDYRQEAASNPIMQTIADRLSRGGDRGARGLFRQPASR